MVLCTGGQWWGNPMAMEGGNVHGFDVHDSEMDTVLKKFLWKKNLTVPNPKIFYIYGGVILAIKGIFFQHLNHI
jgi:hypothetical protein